LSQCSEASLASIRFIQHIATALGLLDIAGLLLSTFRTSSGQQSAFTLVRLFCVFCLQCGRSE
jgi:hypothetical protein